MLSKIFFLLFFIIGNGLLFCLIDEKKNKISELKKKLAIQIEENLSLEKELSLLEPHLSSPSSFEMLDSQTRLFSSYSLIDSKLF
jgi:regulator of replication initiation timing